MLRYISSEPLIRFGSSFASDICLNFRTENDWTSISQIIVDHHASKQLSPGSSKPGPAQDAVRELQREQREETESQ
jgi:hypothetical protein